MSGHFALSMTALFLLLIIFCSIAYLYIQNVRLKYTYDEIKGSIKT